MLKKNDKFGLAKNFLVQMILIQSIDQRTVFCENLVNFFTKK